jgi:hypothetical protein
VIEFRHLTKRFGDIVAVDDLTVAHAHELRSSTTVPPRPSTASRTTSANRAARAAPASSPWDWVNGV